MGDPELGVIEAFYGPPWSEEARRGVITLLSAHGYRFHHYAPKADPHLRAAWRTPWPARERDGIAALAAHCRSHGVRFGIGLSPVGLHAGGDADAMAALTARIREFNEIGVDDLLVQFDDQRGDDAPALAQRQAEIVQRAADVTSAGRVFVCPTYYSEDPLLDRLFGTRPEDYLRDLGRLLDPHVRVYWAGEEVCPAEITLGELRPVTEQLRRRPVLWDNYPVNDGEVMGEHLHLRGFTGRPSSLANAVGGHAINPALQPFLSCIPALTLPASYRDHAGYRYARAQRQAAEVVLGEALAARVMEDLPLLVDRGRDRLTRDERAYLAERYGAFDHPAAGEITAWLGSTPPGSRASAPPPEG